LCGIIEFVLFWKTTAIGDAIRVPKKCTENEILKTLSDDALVSTLNQDIVAK
jgi:hypothetical protein